MFSKLMKKTIAVAAIAAMTSVMAAVATPWWTIDFNSYTDGAKVSASTETQGIWTQQENDLSVVTSQSLSLNTQGEDLLWTPKDPAGSYDSVILDADVTFVASDVEPTTDNSMQTAIYLKATDESPVLCAYQDTKDGPAWQALEGFTIANGATKKVTITIDYSDESGTPMVTLTIDGTSVKYPVANEKEKVSSVAFRGTGVVDNFAAQTSVNSTYVADVDGQGFNTYADALAYVAANGGNLTITGDSAEELSFGTFTFTKNATIDLGGKEITAAFVVDGGAQFSIDNGTVTAPAKNDVIYIKDGKATVGADATLIASTDCAVFMKNLDNAEAQLALDVYGTLIGAEGFGTIQGNGSNKPASVINIYDNATVTNAADLAIYHPQNGTLTIGAATITGTTGIEMRAGNLVVNEGAIIEGTAEFSATPNGNGSTVLGAAIALSQHTTEQPTSVTVNGGTLKGARAFYQDNLASGTSTSVSATIAAGTTLDGAIEVAEEGFVMPKSEVDGSYTLAAADFVVAGMPYNTFAAAYDAATEGATIEVYTDFAASEIITISKSITIDGNDHTLTSTAGRAINIDTTGDVVIKDLTINAAERAINIIDKPATVTLTGVTATADNNAVMIATSAGAAKVTVENCDFTGLAVINVAGAGAQVTVAGSKITNVDANADESYGAITVWTSAEGATVEVTNSEIVVAGDSYEAFVFPGEATVTGVNNVTYCVATIGDAGFDTIEEALKEAKDGDTIVLQRDITASEIITINKDITFDGNGHTLTSTAGRAINIDTTGDVVINDLTINAAERAINIINKPATVTLTGVTATADNNAVMIATSAGAAKVTVENCDFTGLAVINVAGAGAQVTVAGSKITNVDANADENYGAITVWTSAEGATVEVTNSEIVVAGDSYEAFVFPGEATVTGVDNVTYCVATIGDAGFDTIEEAFKEAKDGDTIVLQRDITSSSTITISKDITIDGNGKTLTYTGSNRAITVENTANGADLTVKNLTVDCTANYCQRGINYNTTGTLTLEGVTVKGKNVTYAVNLPGSSVGAEVSIKDSNLSGNIALNVWGENCVVNVKDTILTAIDNNSSEGYSAVMLNNDGETAAEGAVINITGGEINVTGNSYDDSYATSNATLTGKINISESTVVNGNITTFVAVIRYDNGTAYSFTSLEDAFAKADAGDTVKLIANVAEDVTIAATATLDLNGYGATGTFTLTDTAAKLYAAEGLTVVTNVEGYEVVFADGCYSVQEQVVEVEFAPVKTTSIVIDGNTAKLTIDGEYKEVKVYFKATLDAKWTEVVEAKFADGVITVPATTATGFFTVHAR